MIFVRKTTPTIEDIEDSCIKSMGISEQLYFNKSRRWPYCVARKLAYYVCDFYGYSARESSMRLSSRRPSNASYYKKWLQKGEGIYKYTHKELMDFASNAIIISHNKAMEDFDRDTRALKPKHL